MLLKFKKLIRLLGRRGFMWLGLCLLMSLLLVGVEYSIAGFLQLFLVSLGYVDPQTVPRWIRGYTHLTTQTLCTVLLSVGGIRSFALFFSAYSNDVVQETLNARLRIATIFEMLLQNRSKLLPASEVHNRMGEHYPKARHFVFVAINVFIAFVQISFLFLGMCFIAWRESVLSIFGLALTGIFVILCNRIVMKNASKVPEVQKTISKSIERVSRNWLFIKISRTQKEEYSKLVNRIVDYFHFVTKTSLFSTIMLGFPPFLGMTVLAAIIYASRKYFQTEPANLLLFLYLFIRLFQFLGNTAQYFAQATSHYPQFRYAVNIFFAMGTKDLENAMQSSNFIHMARKDFEQIEIDEQHNHLNPEKNEKISAPEISAQNVSVSWEKDREPVFSGINFSVKAGDIVGIVGPSGSGKSTLLLLLLGVLDTDSGNIKIDGLAPAAYFKKYANQIGYVGAEPFLIEGSIEENLKYGLSRKASKTEMYQALENARLKETVENLPGQLEYLLDENGSGLSTGQKQRLSLARAMLRNPAVLVLDEASANLDQDTEKEIAEVIRTLKGKATVLIVSHRKGILASVNKLYSIESGKLSQLSLDEVS